MQFQTYVFLAVADGLHYNVLQDMNSFSQFFSKNLFLKASFGFVDYFLLVILEVMAKQ